LPMSNSCLYWVSTPPIEKNLSSDVSSVSMMSPSVVPQRTGPVPEPWLVADQPTADTRRPLNLAQSLGVVHFLWR